MKSNATEILTKGKMEDIYRFIDAIPEIYLILDSNRQVVYANKAMNEFFQNEAEDFTLGKRPGELLNCRHAAESIYGCGTTETCQTCGAFNAIVESLEGRNAIKECRIEQNESGDAMDFRVWTTPYMVDGEKYSILALSDISDEKRREALERIFFHDILNTVGGLYGIAQLLAECPDDVDEFKEIIVGLTEKLIDEINAQKLLVSAESNELQVNTEKVNSMALLEDMVNNYRKHYLIKNRDLQLDSSIVGIDFYIDKTLLRRVILNMIKNAVEASPAKSTITVGCSFDDSNIEFWVHNPTFIPRDVQLQIFKRSFSTKGSGRGLGTYSMKLLSERYLKGSISFTTSEEFGTVFTSRYPLIKKRFKDE